MELMTASFSGERVDIDNLGFLPISVRGWECILLIYYFTKCVEAVPLQRQDAASVANAISGNWVNRLVKLPFRLRLKNRVPVSPWRM
ncbi:unnamed protein product [Dibothriocephalus latus]|uniref:Uncharacterized protein n=1 Tax=Dibothriocephalus latus TaxID=60516 RepID=A0A3P7NYR9_DIBLA|nr:unnamed protein product [Dibothriocephalus latus]